MWREVTHQRPRLRGSPPDPQQGPDRSRLLQPWVSPALMPARPPDVQPTCRFLGIGSRGRGGYLLKSLSWEAGGRQRMCVGLGGAAINSREDVPREISWLLK